MRRHSSSCPSLSSTLPAVRLDRRPLALAVRRLASCSPSPGNAQCTATTSCCSAIARRDDGLLRLHRLERIDVERRHPRRAFELHRVLDHVADVDRRLAAGRRARRSRDPRVCPCVGMIVISSVTRVSPSISSSWPGCLAAARCSRRGTSRACARSGASQASHSPRWIR